MPNSDAQNSNIEKLEKLQVALIREQSYDDLYIFAKYVCRWDKMEYLPHREICDNAVYGIEKCKSLGIEKAPTVLSEFGIDVTGKPKKLMMLPRGVFKSTIMTNAFVLWLMWKNPSIRIMIDSETLGNSKLYLAGIKDQIENNAFLREICVDKDGKFLLEPHYKVSGGFTEDQIILKERKRRGMKEPTVFCSGVDNARTGMHPDVIIFDDVVSERNVTTDEQREKVKNHYQFSLSLLEPTGLLAIIGTRYHMDDLYSGLIHNPNFDRMIRSCYNEYGSLYAPTILSEEFLSQQREEQGEYIFACQYLLNPLDSHKTVFDITKLRYWDAISQEKDIVTVRYIDEFGRGDSTVINKMHILTDLAVSDKKEACNTVVLLVGEDVKKRLFVIEYVADKLRYDRFLDIIFDYRKRWGNLIRTVGVEIVAYQKVMKYLLEDEMRRRGVFINIKELKADTNKERRIEGLQPIIQSGTLYISRNHRDLRAELEVFPLGKKRDIIDALAYIQQLLRPGMSTNVSRVYEYKRNNPICNY